MFALAGIRSGELVRPKFTGERGARLTEPRSCYTFAVPTGRKMAVRRGGNPDSPDELAFGQLVHEFQRVDQALTLGRVAES
jgi:hypothetical protein